MTHVKAENKAGAGFLALLMRSPDIGDGWRLVSGMLRPLVTKKVAETPDLFEVRDEPDSMQIRLTDAGLAVWRHV